MWRRLLPLLPLLLVSAGCGRPQSLSNVPIGPGGTCKISVGDQRSHVLVRCAGPCATSTVAEGVCADGAKGVCENKCDIYQDVEVCYVAEKVVTVDRLDRVSGRHPWCFWPDPAAQQRQRR